MKWMKIRPAWSCRNSMDCGNLCVTTDDDQPPKGWVRRWRGWGGWTWFCNTCVEKEAGMIGPWKKRKTTHIRRHPLRPGGLKGHVAAVVYQAMYTGDTVPGWQTFDESGRPRASGPECGDSGRTLADADLEKK